MSMKRERITGNLKIKCMKTGVLFLLLLFTIYGLCACSGTPAELQEEAALVNNSAETMTNAVPENCVTVIYVTINPRLALYLDDKNVIIGVECLNEDAETVSAGINLVGQSVDGGMQMVIEAAIQKEFLTEEKEVKIEVAHLTEHAGNQVLQQLLEAAVVNTTSGQNMEVNVNIGNVAGTEGETVGVIYCPECHGTGECIWCGTGDDCDACDGTKENICTNCNEGMVPCHKCNGVGQGESNGTGSRTIEVEYCTKCGARRDGSGEAVDLTCNICNGTGYHSCHACRGAKGFDCWTCDGGYETCCSDPNCPRCKGTGRAVCGQCDNGWRICNECGGTGSEVCRECSGGIASCPHPGDAVEIRIETVEETTENTAYCDSCGGAGTERCPECGGEYRQACHECHGTGKAPCGICEETGRCMHCGGDGFVEL